MPHIFTPLCRVVALMKHMACKAFERYMFYNHACACLNYSRLLKARDLSSHFLNDTNDLLPHDDIEGGGVQTNVMFCNL